MIKKESATKLRQGGEKYTVIPSSTIKIVKDPAALGLLCYLLEKSDNWIVRHQDIKNHFGIGKDKCQRLINLLKEFNLIESVINRNESGEILGRELVVYSSPTALFSDGRLNQPSEKPADGKQGILTKDQSLPNNQLITNNQKTLLPAVKKPKFCPVHFASSEYQGFELNLESWAEWCEFRKDDKKAIIKTTATKQLKMLVTHSIDEQKEIIDKSIIGQYQGLFPIKNKTQPKYANQKPVGDNNDLSWMNNEILHNENN